MKITAVVEDVGQVTVELNVWVCPSCGVLYGIPKAFAERLREAGGHYFCPNGHQLSWTASEADKLRAKLKDAERDLAWYKDGEATARARADRAERSRAAIKGQVTKLRRRVVAGACPFGCRRHFANLERHVATKHAGQELEAEGEAEGG